jgi:hypothetical protein
LTGCDVKSIPTLRIEVLKLAGPQMTRRISQFGEKLHLELKMSRTVCLEVRGRRVSAAFAQLFHDPAGLVWKNWFLLYKLFVSMRFSTAGGAVNEFKAQFTKDGKKTRCVHNRA